MPFYQDPQPTLTLTRVAPAPMIVAEIAKTTGERLEVSPTLATEILMVAVEGARPSEVLAKLAVAATARWEPIEGGYRLVPDPAARSVEASAERARRYQAFADSIKKNQEAAAQAKKDGAAEMGGFGRMMFGGGANDFLPLLDLNALAAMEPGDRIVFATAPNGAQRPLKGNPTPIVANLIAGHNKTAKTMSTGMDSMPDEMSGFMAGPIGDRIKKMSRPIVGAPAKVLVVVSRGSNPLFGNGDDLRVEARAYDAKGQVLIEEVGTVGSGMMEKFVEMAVEAEKKKGAAAPVAKTTPIAYSPEAKALMNMRGAGNGNAMAMGAGMSGPKITPALRERLFDPVKYEPLALLPGESLAALAKARRKPLVACVPDDAYPGLIASGVPDTLEELEGELKTGAMRLVPDATFLVVKAAAPDAARRNRVDRSALAGLMRAVADHESPTLAELAEFAAKTPPPSRNDLEMSYVATFVPNMMGSMSGMVSWDALRLYAALSPAQRNSLATGAKIPFNTLNPAAQSSLRTLLYGAGDNLTVERGQTSDLPDVISMGMKMVMGGGGVDVRDEPTEVAPRGLPADGFLQAQVTTESIVRPVASNDEPTYYSLGTDELAMMRMFSATPMAEQMMGEAMKLPEQGRMGSRTSWNLRGYVAPGAYVGSVLLDDQTPKNAPRVSLNALPSDFQAQVAQRAERLKKSPLGSIMSIMGTLGKQRATP